MIPRVSSKLIFFVILVRSHWLVEEITAFVVQKSSGNIGQNTMHKLTSKSPLVPSMMPDVFNTIQTKPLQFLSPSLLTANLAETVTNVATGIGGVVVVMALLVLFLSAYVVPTAAKQIEDLARQLDPALWREYERKLGSGESLAMRPELMQELGTKVLELQSKMMNDGSQGRPSEEGVIEGEGEVAKIPEVISESTSTSDKIKNPSTEGSIDVEVISKNKWDD